MYSVPHVQIIGYCTTISDNDTAVYVITNGNSKTYRTKRTVFINYRFVEVVTDCEELPPCNTLLATHPNYQP